MRDRRRSGSGWSYGTRWVGGAFILWAAGLLAGAADLPTAALKAEKPTAVTAQCVNEACHAQVLNHKVMLAVGRTRRRK